MPVTNSLPAHLRLHVEEQGGESSSLPLPELGPLLKAFEHATGWQLRYEQSAASGGEIWSTTIDSGSSDAPGRLILVGSEIAEKCPGVPAIELHQARPLALSLGHLLGEFNRLRAALRQREAELAAGVPIAIRSGDEPHLAERLEAVIQGGAESVGCQAAGLYLLDEATSELKLRAAWGLSPERLLAPARPLRGAVADLEALVGHAVVLEDTSLLPHWRCPEPFPSAVCVPVASPTVPLGTFWAFSDRQRDFSPQETNLLEIVAGRLAADLEREMLLAASTTAKKNDKQLHVAALWQAERLPSVTPLLDDYGVAGWTRQAHDVGGDFHDWSVLPDGRLALAVGSAEGKLLEAALGAASLHAAVRSHAAHRHTAAVLLGRVNESLLAASPGDQRASLAYALLDPEANSLNLALAGQAAAIRVTAEDRQILTADSPRLGDSLDAVFHHCELSLSCGEIVVLVSGGVRSALDAAGLRIGEASLASLVERHFRDSAEMLITRLRRLIDHADQPTHDLTLLVLKRRN
jgi:serine phosphatase RsbU (regulator of sigma subunit)